MHGLMVGMLAEKGKYAQAIGVAIKVLEIFLSTFFNLYEPTSGLFNFFFSPPWSLLLVEVYCPQVLSRSLS